MAKAPASTKNVRPAKGDTEAKGRKARGSKRTSIGKAKNSRPKNKNAVRNRKGR